MFGYHLFGIWVFPFASRAAFLRLSLASLSNISTSLSRLSHRTVQACGKSRPSLPRLSQHMPGLHMRQEITHASWPSAARAPATGPHKLRPRGRARTGDMHQTSGLTHTSRRMRPQFGVVQGGVPSRRARTAALLISTACTACTPTARPTSRVQRSHPDAASRRALRPGASPTTSARARRGRAG